MQLLVLSPVSTEKWIEVPRGLILGQGCTTEKSVSSASKPRFGLCQSLGFSSKCEAAPAWPAGLPGIDTIGEVKCFRKISLKNVKLL